MWKELKEKCKKLQYIVVIILGNCIKNAYRVIWEKAFFIDSYEKKSVVSFQQ